MDKYVVLEKLVGETPLMAAEKWRAENPQYKKTRLAYAGRLDPMASGKLLVLIGDECKNQANYHGLDKAYDFSVLFGIESDTQDVLGRLKTCSSINQAGEQPVTAELGKSETGEKKSGLLKSWFSKSEASPAETEGDASSSTTPLSTKSDFGKDVSNVCAELTGNIELPYPTYSSKTVKGKPLIVWTLENRLDEIDIPTNHSVVFELKLNKIETIERTEMVEQALNKVNSIPKVTDPRKNIGNDFRRDDVRADWNKIKNNSALPEIFTIAHFSCVASTGTYMRTLASEIAKKLDSCGLAWSIHRTHIGAFNPETKNWDLDY